MVGLWLHCVSLQILCIPSPYSPLVPVPFSVAYIWVHIITVISLLINCLGLILAFGLWLPKGCRCGFPFWWVVLFVTITVFVVTRFFFFPCGATVRVTSWALLLWVLQATCNHIVYQSHISGELRTDYVPTRDGVVGIHSPSALFCIHITTDDYATDIFISPNPRATCASSADSVFSCNSVNKHQCHPYIVHTYNNPL